MINNEYWDLEEKHELTLKESISSLKLNLPRIVVYKGWAPRGESEIRTSKIVL
jgi:hypothetical protein